MTASVRILAAPHLLLQVRTRVLNNDLAADFHRWYPGFTHVPQAALNDQPAAA